MTQSLPFASGNSDMKSTLMTSHGVSQWQNPEQFDVGLPF